MLIIARNKLLFVIMLGHPNKLKAYIFIQGWNGNLGILFYTALRCKKFYKIGPWITFKVYCNSDHILNLNHLNVEHDSHCTR